MGNSSDTPVRSMTGFARAFSSTGDVELSVEVKAVNNRFLEVVFRAPKCFSRLERDVRSLIGANHKRGRLDLTVSRATTGAGSAEADFEFDELDRMVRKFSAACKRYGVTGDHRALLLASSVTRESTRSEETSGVSEEEERELLGLVAQASLELARMKEQEGVFLVDDIRRRLDSITAYKAEIEKVAPELPGRFRERLEERLKNAKPEVSIDPNRVAIEVALLAERIDVSEELTRLSSHLALFGQTLKGHAEGVGRKLDFLLQEFNREFNTIGSKAQDAHIQGLVVEAKAELEKIREQVQNIE